MGVARRWSYLLTTVLPLLAVLGLSRVQFGELSDIRNFVFDTYQRLAPRPWNPETPVRIVDIDDASLARVGQWPWPRSRLAELVEKLRAKGAAAIAFDMVFSEPDRTSPENLLSLLPDTPGRRLMEQELGPAAGNDVAFGEAIGAAPVVLGAILTTGSAPVAFPAKLGVASAGDDPKAFMPAFGSAIVPLPTLADKATGVGALNWLPDRDQTVRRLPLVLRVGDAVVPGLALESLRVALGASTLVIRASNASGQSSFGAKTGINGIKIGGQEIETDPHGEIRVRFSRTEPRRFIPAWKVLDGSVPPDEIAGRIILVGTSAAGLLDQRATPVDASVAGVEVHVQLIEHIVENASLVRPDWAPGLEIAIAIVAGLAIAFLLPRVEALGTALLGVLAIVIFAAISWWAFSREGLLVDPLMPSAAGAAVYASGVIFLYRAEQHQKRWVREAFGHFVGPAVVERLTRDPSRLVLGGETRTLTVMFCDIRGFTTISEGMTAAELATFMNTYLSTLTEVVLDHQATLDKYIGDAIMAFWNAPLDDDAHGANAARAALAMIDALAKLNAGWRAEAEGGGRAIPPVRFGIGLATGECSVGNFGSSRRFDYSAFGDDVNLASRLEGASKVYGIEILASERTFEASRNFAWLEVDALRVKGKNAAARIYTLLGDPTHAQSPGFRAQAEAHRTMLTAFRGCRFIEAEAMAGALATLPGNAVAPLYTYYAALSRTFAAAPPPPGWDGVTELSHK